MFSLDFKLTSGQVRALLYVYHGTTRTNDRAPILAFFLTSHFLSSTTALKAKGLIVHVPITPANGRQFEGEELDHQWWQVTDRGHAIASMIVEQAQQIVALDVSRGEYAARLAKRSDTADSLPRPQAAA